ncbi:hypothetical protein C2S52_000893 [Perilla frutescens var. hirtella]|nr:hypothetical protein C2S52_000893 [Perilla frutescens var. hirtella]
MPPMWSLLSQINPFRSTWALQLRLVRAYEIPAYGKNNEIKDYVCIFHDREGVRIQATIQRDLVDRFKSSLIEGNIYALKNVSIASNNMRFKTTTHQYRIIFLQKTLMHDLLEEGFPHIIYNFKSMKNVISMENVDESEYFGVIKVNSAFHVTKLIFNANISEVNELRNSVTANTIGAISTSSTMNMVGNLEHEDVKNISEITENNLVASSEASIITPKKVPEDLLEESSVKRSLFDDFSSTVPTKKTKVVVKIEKEEH